MACAANVEQNRWDIGIRRLQRETPDSHIMEQNKPWQKRNAIITKLKTTTTTTTTGDFGQVVLKGNHLP